MHVSKTELLSAVNLLVVTMICTLGSGHSEREIIHGNYKRIHPIYGSRVETILT